MRFFNVPYCFDEEEKIIGGRWSLRQLAYIAGGLLAGLFVGYILPFPLFLRVFFGGTLVAIGAFFGFFKLPKSKIRVDTYLSILFQYRRREKEFPFRRR